MDSPQKPPLAHLFKGTFVHASRSSPMDVLHGHLLGVGDDGRIMFLEQADQQEQLAKKWGFKASDVRELSNHEFFMPGMVDTHIHASQYAFAGTRVDLPLLEWLNTYTFPTEVKYKDNDFAEEVYTRVVRRTLKNGTTTACYFATIHRAASLLLAEIIDKFGQRAFVGKVCMDINEVVPEYKETTDESVEETERFVKELLEKKSHISENDGEIKLVEQMFPDYKDYTDLYDKTKLLTSKTVMAHGCHLSDEELKLFSLRGAAIAHCPNSNFSLCSGILNVQNVLKHNVKLGLGTDVAGGYSSSMLDAIRRSMSASNTLLLNKVNNAALTLKEAFRLATLGGSQVLGLDDVIGNFEVGKEFDALLINPKASDSPFDLFAGDTFEDIIQKFLYLGDDRNINEVYVAGKQVVPFSSSV
ncbi:guanine deaminase isoform X2 [Chelonoidis abingdonii]|uniref:guanine deaminase isoform X2 n=1 Tax=Chelonoidis abingdonii TaxID=106734 RepID=UPI0013F192BD|nr:guanine deaminase isoform X2 [Chelonoidis abingdonii]